MHRIFLKFFFFLATLFPLETCIADTQVVKKNVLYTFVDFDSATDHFAKNIFPYWENETFDVFDRVKNRETIAIDIGAWIGTTAIWLSKNFYHVIAVEPDKVSLQCLQKNLNASNCPNVTICLRPLSSKTENVIFGPRGSNLNESISYVKSSEDSSQDYSIPSITFKQLIYDYLYTNKDLSARNISFIKCDIEGSEEEVLEDILHFAFYNNCKVYMSFHLDWWKSKKITDFEYLFKFFKTNCPTGNVCEYIQKNPFASLLFEPLNDGRTLIKRNLTAAIIGYNQYTYIKNMVNQLEKYTTDIVIIDNNSNFEPLLDYYKNDFKYTLLKMNANFGSNVYNHEKIKLLLGDVHILTDPDLKFNPNLPKNFIETLIEIQNYFKASRVGFALLIDSDDLRTDLMLHHYTIKSWESQFWQIKLHYPYKPSLELYKADIDTTFCIINRKNSGIHIRVAGDYTCVHIPWHKDFRQNFKEGEFESYLKNNNATNWFK